MTDLIFIVVTAAFFAIAVAYVRGIARTAPPSGGAAGRAQVPSGERM